MGDSRALAAGRLAVVQRHLTRAKTCRSIDVEFCARGGNELVQDDDVVIVSALRTPIGKAFRGSFKDVAPHKLLETVIKRVLQHAKLEPRLVDDVIVGCVRGDAGQTARDVRIAALLCSIPKESSSQMLCRQCGSGLQAVATAVAHIKAGYYDIAIAGGMESMSAHANRNKQAPQGTDRDAMQHPLASGAYLTMVQTSENVSRRFGISREQQDYYGLHSQKRAVAATERGAFRDEIVPVEVDYVDAQTGQLKKRLVERDDGLRPGTSASGLAKLRPVLKGGSTTAGNASQVSDGASACLVMKRSKARSLGIKPIASLRSFAVAGVEPAIMGIGPVKAIPKALLQAGLTKEDIDLWEINEAFASQFAYCIDTLKLDYQKVNVNGGAIALGHPVGMTGCRMIATLVHELAKRKQKLGVVSMCMGTGMGAAAVIQMEH